MPTYSYVCTQCDHRFDVRQDFSDPALSDCPECSGRLRKLFGNVGVVFKGSGFYRTDSRAKSERSAATPAANGSAGKTAAKSETQPKSDQKPATATATTSSAAASD